MSVENALPAAEPVPASAPHSDRHWVWQVTTLSLILGVMLALALRTTAQIRSSGLPDRGFNDLKDIRRQNQGLLRQRDLLREDINTLRNSTTSEKNTGQELQSQLAEYKALTGYAPVRGSGLEIVLRDSPLPMVPGTESLRDAYLVMVERDVTGVINELWAAGAEAIAIAGKNTDYQRFVVTSTIQGQNRTAVINGAVLPLPLTIRAIGNPKELKAALQMPEGIVAKVGLRDLEMITIKESQQLELPAYTQPGIANSASAVERQATADR